MLSRPTTEQLILDCRNELLNTIDPAVSSEPVKIAIQMMENVLRNCATRAANEIAWMHDEIAAMVTFAGKVAQTSCATPALTDALRAFESKRSASLHLDDVAANYDLAGECLSAAIDAVMAAGDDALHLEARAILSTRLDHENQIMGEWAFVGRS